MSYVPDPPSSAARRDNSRYLGPGILLMVLGGLNLLYGGFCGIMGTVYLVSTDQMAQEAEKQWSAEQKKQMQDMNWTAHGVVVGTGASMLGIGITGLLAAVVMILGGLGMVLLRWRGLALFGAILAMIPCVSATSCILVGIGAGIWALAVLSGPQAKEAFQRRPRIDTAGETPRDFADENQY